MAYIDTHAHLYLNQFKNDTHEVVERAKQDGVEKCVLPNIDSESVNQVQTLTQAYPDFFYPAMGLHPTSVKENYKDELEIIKSKVYNGQWIAIGEMGVDLYWDKTFLKQQIDAFHAQIDWSLELNLPVIIHARDSLAVIISELKKRLSDNIKGVFHCFIGTSEEAKKIIDMGFYLGIGGVLTFKNSGLDKVIEDVDLSRIVLETDAPFLAPVPYRGKRNESSYIKHVAEKLAEVKNISVNQLGEITTKNAHQLFNFT